MPDLAINVLSKSTWRADLSENVDICKSLEIPIYVVFSPYKVSSKIYHPPFLRVHILTDDGISDQQDLYGITLEEGKSINADKIIDISNQLPFRLGLMRMEQRHEGDLPLYRLIFLDPSKPEIFLTEKEKIEGEKEQIEERLRELEDKVKKYQETYDKPK
ncbi:MAG: hypothetical protein ACOC44_13635 [Promethearchaeia archaeon]